MQVFHGLPAICPIVCDEPEAARAILSAQPGSHGENMAQRFNISLCHIFKRVARDDQQVHWRLWRDVIERDANFILMQQRHIYLAARDAAKNGICHVVPLSYSLWSQSKEFDLTGARNLAPALCNTRNI